MCQTLAWKTRANPGPGIVEHTADKYTDLETIQKILGQQNKELAMVQKSTTPKKLKKPNARSRSEDSHPLPGWPGYRTREGRSGYDPIDTRTEAAHTAGTIIQRLFTGFFRNPFHVALLGAVGLILITPLFLGVAEAMNGNWLPWNAWLFILITGVAGAAVLINFIKNLIRIFRR